LAKREYDKAIEGYSRSLKLQPNSCRATRKRHHSPSRDPLRFLGKDRFLALCLSREEPRQFYLDRCQNVRLARAADFLMPVAMAG